MNRIYITLVLLLLLRMSSFSQVDTLGFVNELSDSNTVRIALKARYADKGVLLRWAPSRAGGWVLLNKVGYILQRRELNDSTASEWTTLSPTPIKPQPLEAWSKFAKDTANAYPLIAAQALYGKNFGNQPAVKMADKADELTNRYSFALLAADLSFETATYSGVGYLDETVQAGKLYGYRIFAAAALKDYFPADTGMVALQTTVKEKPPIPVISELEEGEQKVTVFWNKAMHQPYYTAYYVERSEDGRSFKALHGKPYLQFDNPALEESAPVFSYYDSVQVNYKPYWYRIVGIDAFGQLSDPGEAVRGMGVDRTPPPAPKKLTSKILADGSVELTWQADDNPDLDGFLVGRSEESSLSGYEKLTATPLAKGIRRYVDKAPKTDAPNYYVVAAVDTAKNASISMTAHVAFIDSVAPAPPTALKAKIDTLGILRLSWQASPERDVKGYIVSYANDSTHFFTSAVKAAIPDTVFVDTLSLATLSENIYYRVRAVDHNNNTSGESAILTVKKPDIIPPVAPQFVTYDVAQGKVTLHWLRSTSDDVVRHELYRKKAEQATWELAATVTKVDSFNVFIDTSFSPNTRYVYMLKALDDDGLYSPESALLPIRTLANLVGKAVEAFEASAGAKGVQVSWKLPAGDIDRCVIYRSVNGGAFETIQVIKAPGTTYTDVNTKSATTYEYTCKLFYKDGKASPFSTVKKLAMP